MVTTPIIMPTITKWAWLWVWPYAIEQEHEMYNNKHQLSCFEKVYVGLNQKATTKFHSLEFSIFVANALLAIGQTFVSNL